MKRGAPDHWKMSDLSKRLDVPERYAKSWSTGALERLWHFAGLYAPRGDIGRVPDEAIARACGWPENEGEIFTNALVDAKWLDTSPIFRLTIHDWSEHCEDSVHSKVARLKTYFACGKAPKLTGLRRYEKEELEVFYATPVQPVATPVQPVATPVQPVATPVQPVATPVQPVATPVQPQCNPLATASAIATTTTLASAATTTISPPTPSENMPDENLTEVCSGFDRHMCHANREPRDTVIQIVMTMNGKFNMEKFRANHQPYCDYWSQKGWNFCKVTFLGWINAGMPPSPSSTVITAVQSGPVGPCGKCGKSPCNCHRAKHAKMMEELDSAKSTRTVRRT